MQFLIFVIIVAVYGGFKLFKNIKETSRKKYDNVINMEEEREGRERKKDFQFKKPEIKKVPWQKIGIIVVIVILILIIQSSFFTVDQTEYAFITTFDKPSGELLGSGLKFKLPSPIQKVHKVSKETYSLQIGYHQDNLNQPETNMEESKMITGDENIILADIEIQWRITDPIKFKYNLKEPEKVLRNAASASLRSTVGNSLVDDALTDGRTEIIADIRTKLTTLIEQYDMGIAIINVNLQDVDLPTDEVDRAFKKVTDAREERSTKVNEANKYKNEKLNQVKGESDAIISRAEGDKAAIVEKARGDVASFNALYSEYLKNPDITRKRLLIETLTQVYGTSKLVIINDDSTLTHLPLTELLEKGGEK